MGRCRIEVAAFDGRVAGDRLYSVPLAFYSDIVPRSLVWSGDSTRFAYISTAPTKSRDRSIVVHDVAKRACVGNQPTPVPFASVAKADEDTPDAEDFKPFRLALSRDGAQVAAVETSTSLRASRVRLTTLTPVAPKDAAAAAKNPPKLHGFFAAKNEPAAANAADASGQRGTWESATDPKGRQYWFNRELNVSSWERPAGTSTCSGAPAAHGQEALEPPAASTASGNAAGKQAKVHAGDLVPGTPAAPVPALAMAPKPAGDGAAAAADPAAPAKGPQAAAAMAAPRTIIAAAAAAGTNTPLPSNAGGDLQSSVFRGNLDNVVFSHDGRSLVCTSPVGYTSRATHNA